MMPLRLETHLNKAHVFYTRVPHNPARSSASLLHVPGKEVAKTVALHAGKQVLLAVLPASYHVSLQKLAGLVGGEVKLMDEQECAQLFPDCQPGAVPSFGELYGVPVYLDASLAEVPEIIFGAGTLADGIRMGNVDFVHLVKPRICSFAEVGEIRGKTIWEDISAHEEGGGK